MNLAQMRDRLRIDLHDQDSANYRWTDGELDRHVQRTVREFSLAAPLEAKTTLAATPGSRDVSVASLTDIVAVEAVEYPTGHYPPSYVRYSVWLSTLTLLSTPRPPPPRTWPSTTPSSTPSTPRPRPSRPSSRT